MAEGGILYSPEASAPRAASSHMDLRATDTPPHLSGTALFPRMPEPHQLREGALVRRTHPWDGSRRSGQPVGPVLTVARFYDFGELSIAELADGSHAFAWTLVPVKSATPSEAQSA